MCYYWAWALVVYMCYTSYKAGFVATPLQISKFFLLTYMFCLLMYKLEGMILKNVQVHVYILSSFVITDG